MGEDGEGAPFSEAEDEKGNRAFFEEGGATSSSSEREERKEAKEKVTSRGSEEQA